MKAFTVRLADDEHDRLADYAHARRLSMGKVVRAAVGAYLDLMEGLNDAEQARSVRARGSAGRDDS